MHMILETIKMTSGPGTTTRTTVQQSIQDPQTRSTGHSLTCNAKEKLSQKSRLSIIAQIPYVVPKMGNYVFPKLIQVPLKYQS